MKTTKNTKNTKPTVTTTVTADESAIPSLEAITLMEEVERLTLYRRCDEQMRSRFLIQGKILHATEGGEDALRAAGIPRSSLHNAKMAAIALQLTGMKWEGKPVMIHTGGKKPVPFTEEVYDTLTLERCRLIAHGCTGSGQVRHRPLPQTFYAILKGEEWWVELEHYFEHGMIRAMKQAQEQEAAQRSAMLQTIDITGPVTTEAPTVEMPAAPVIVSVPVAEEDDAPIGEGTPENVVAFTAPETPEAPEAPQAPAPKLEVLPPENGEGDEAPSFAVIDDAIDYLSSLIQNLDPAVSGEDRLALAQRLRTLADELSATCAAGPELATPAKGKKKKAA